MAKEACVYNENPERKMKMKMKKYTVVITDSPFPSSQPFYDVLADLDCDIIMADLKDKEGFYNLCQMADGMIVTYADINAEVISNLNKCQVLARTGVAVNNINLQEATKKKIFVTNVVTPQIVDVANHAVTLLLSSVKKIVLLNNQVKKGYWDFKAAVPIFKLEGKTMGLAGFGNIARNVAQKVKVFGINVVAYDPFVNQSIFEEMGVKKVEFAELLQVSDYISVHMPLTDQTRKSFSYAEFKQMKPNCYIINTARGEIIDEDALRDALDKKLIAGAALDVLATEFPKADYPLYAYDNVIVTPHSAYYSEECVKDLQISAATEVVRVLQGKAPISLVNKELNG